MTFRTAILFLPLMLYLAASLFFQGHFLLGKNGWNFWGRKTLQLGMGIHVLALLLHFLVSSSSPFFKYALRHFTANSRPAGSKSTGRELYILPPSKPSGGASCLFRATLPRADAGAFCRGGIRPPSLSLAGHPRDSHPAGKRGICPGLLRRNQLPDSGALPEAGPTEPLPACPGHRDERHRSFRRGRLLSLYSGIGNGGRLAIRSSGESTWERATPRSGWPCPPG